MSLGKNFVWTVAGNVVYAGCQWSMLVVLSKTGSAFMVGRFALALAICAPVYALANLQLRDVQVATSSDLYRFRDFLTLRLLTVTAAFTVILLIALIGGFKEEMIIVIAAVSFAKGCEWVADIIYGLAIKCERLDYIAKSRILRGCLSLVSLGLGLTWTGTLSGGVIAMAVCNVILLMAHDGPAARSLCTATPMPAGDVSHIETPFRYYPKVCSQTMRHIVILAFPLGMANAVQIFNTSIPRYLIAWYRGESELGVFAAMMSFVIAGTLLNASVGQAIMSRLAFSYASGDKHTFRRYATGLVGLAVCAGCGLVVLAYFAGDMLLSLLYGPAFAAYDRAFMWLMAAILFLVLSNTVSFLLTTMQQFKPQMSVQVLSTITLTTTGFLLIPQYGLYGVAGAIFLSSLLSLGLLIRILISAQFDSPMVYTDVSAS